MERAPTDWATVFAASLLTFAAAPAAAEAPIYKGAQFQVNSETDGRQAYSAAAAAADGDFIVVWRDRFEITGQRYDSNGAAQGSEFHIGTVSTQYHSNFPSVAAAPDGDFVVVWDGLPDLEIHGRRFAADGSPKDASFQVNTYTTGDQEHASVAVAAVAGTLVSSVRGRFAAGRVNSETSDEQPAAR